MFCILPKKVNDNTKKKAPVSMEEYKKALETVNNYNNM